MVVAPGVKVGIGINVRRRVATVAVHASAIKVSRLIHIGRRRARAIACITGRHRVRRIDSAAGHAGSGQNQKNCFHKAPSRPSVKLTVKPILALFGYRGYVGLSSLYVYGYQMFRSGAVIPVTNSRSPDAQAHNSRLHWKVNR